MQVFFRWVSRTVVCACLVLAPSVSSDVNAADNPSLGIEDVLTQMERRYDVSGFTALFDQVSTLKAMEITDTATGKLFIKPPDMMRWEYDTPEKQIIMSNGETLWIFRPEDRQVMVGRAPEFFAGGKGASFLSNMKVIRESFLFSLDQEESPHAYRIKLVPREKTFDLTAIFLSVSKTSFEVLEVTTVNIYGDETRIALKFPKFNLVLDNAMFNFTIPEGIEVLQMDQ